MSSRSTEVDQAIDDVAKAATKLARRIAKDGGDKADELKGRADALQTVALSVSAVAYGPSGWSGSTDYRYDARHRYGDDEGAPRQTPGFGSHHEDPGRR